MKNVVRFKKVDDRDKNVLVFGGSDGQYYNFEFLKQIKGLKYVKFDYAKDFVCGDGKQSLLDSIMKIPQLDKNGISTIIVSMRVENRTKNNGFWSELFSNIMSSPLKQKKEKELCIKEDDVKFL